MQPVRHEAKRGRFLLSSYLIDVLAELLLTLTRITRRPFRLDDGKDGAIGVVEGKISKAVPWRWVITSDRYLELYLRTVREIPPRALEPRVYEKRSGSSLVEVHVEMYRPIPIY